MKKLKLTSKILTIAFFAFLIFGCDDNEEIVPTDPDADYDVELDVSEGETPVEEVTVDANAQSTITALVSFSSTSDAMRRLYITQNIAGQGEEIYEPIEAIDLKGDGSVDLENESSNSFEFEFDLPVPSGVDDGTVIYTFWATSGKGDFRDYQKRLVTGPAYIELTYGSGTNPGAELTVYDNVQLEAPLADGSSETFVSLIDGETYRIDQGNEFVAYWDFGYYYGDDNDASLSSTADYPSSVIDIETVASTVDEYNHTYFQASSYTSADFDDATMSADIESITQSSNETITNLEVGDIIEFVDNYGNKGLIRVEEIEGTFNSGDYMTVDIKVQPPSQN